MRLFLSLILGIFCFLPSPTLSNRVTSISPKGMVLIPEGIYIMGSYKSLIELKPADLLNTDRHALGPENPAHNVSVNSFYIDIYEVSNGDYMAFIKTEKVRKPLFWDNPDFNNYKQPVVGVSWKDAQSYCGWKGGRLPTEAEWEKASRGKRSIDFPWGNEAPDRTKINFNLEVKKTTPIGSYGDGKSDYGVYDLSGNVSEWVYDWHLAEFYLFSPKNNPRGPEKGHYKVTRGGNWRNNSEDVTTFYRNATVPSMRSKTLGFRCVQSKSPTPYEYPDPS